MLKSDFFFLAPHHCTALGFPSQCVVPAVQGRTFQDLIDQIAGGRNLRSVKIPSTVQVVSVIVSLGYFIVQQFYATRFVGKVTLD